MATHPSPAPPVRCLSWSPTRGALWASLALCGCSTTHSPRFLTPSPEFPAIIRPLDGSVGSVIQIHERLRFVILDYSLSALPPSGSSLVVYRGSERVGSLRLSRWTRPGTAAADIVDGAPRIGDVARPE